MKDGDSVTQRRCIGVICAIGGLRVALLVAAYPVFSHIDEPLHYDMVLKYARHYLTPGRDDHFEPDLGRMIALYHSPEYLARPPYPPPLYRSHDPRRQQAIDAEMARVAAQRNVEAAAPPAYYIAAALWYRIGWLFGVRELALIYWVRMLNVLIVAAVIALTWRFCREFHPDPPQLALAAAALIALVPQDVFYAINSDALSPLAVLLALYLTARWRRDGHWQQGVAAGLATGAAVLTKYPNVGVAIVLLFICIADKRRRTIIPLLCAGVLVALWLIRCQFVLGDFTGSREKIRLMGWTPLPLAATFHHPIFTAPGLFDFLHRLAVTFWRGELDWHGTSQRLAWADACYCLATGLATVVLLLAMLRNPTDSLRRQRRLILAHLVLVLTPVLFLATLSTRFDFGNCFYPSRGFPYFASGRLMLGALAPFAILYATALVSFQSRRISLVLLMLTLLVCAISEAYLSPTVFSSPYNLLHITREAT